MKKILFTSILGISTLFAQGQNINVQNFDGCALPSNWAANAVTGTNTWQFGAASNYDGGSIDGSCYAFLDDDALGSGGAALVADLVTPVMDLSTYSNAEMRFDYIFEDLGGSSLSVSFWNGTSWDVVWTEVSDPGCFGFYPDCSPRQAVISLAGYLTADFQAKITYNDDNSWAWWAAIDNFSIYLPPSNDAELIGIASPVTGCGLGTSENVSFYVYNNGQNEITALDAEYTVDGGTPVIESFSVSIMPGDTGIITFIATLDASAIGTFSLDGSISMSGDLDILNDAVSSSVTNIPLLGATLPYFQDFESGDGGWIAGGALNTWALGAPTGTFIDAAFSGINAWVTNLAGTYNDLENSYVESPCMDFSSLVVDPVLRFKQIFNTEECCDEGWVDISYDGGTTWTRLGLSGEPDNWYNYEFDNYWNGDSGDPTVWRTATHLLDGAAGESSVKIRFFFSSDGSVVFEGFGLDDIEIFEQPAVNAGVVAINSPVTGCGLGITDVVVTIENFGSEDISGFDVSYDAGAGVVVEQFTGTLAGGQTAEYTFTVPVDLTVPNTYSIMAYTDVANDGDLFNDSTEVSITNSPVVAGLPYFEDFEAGQGGWYGETIGEVNSWQFGEPTGTFIDAANSGINAWVTNLSGTYTSNEDNYIVSPCFDFSSLVLDPILSFAHIYNTEECCDEGWVDLSLDGGVTWEKVGAFGEGENWYVDEFNNWWNGNSGVAGQWINATHLLDGAAGESSVRIRFFFSSDGSVEYEGFGIDDISITEQAAINGATIAVNSPISGCGLTDSEVVSIKVANVGSDIIDPVSVSYQVNGGEVFTQSFALTLNAFDTVDVAFDDLLDLSIAGDYTLSVWFNVAGDGNTTNDTITLLVQSVPTITAIPYAQDFENGTGGWSSSGVNGVWELGQPQNVLINTAFSGENAWCTNLTTPNYVDQQVSYLTSPCLDFSSLSDDPIISFAIQYNSELGWDGTVLEVSTDGGATWDVLGNAGEGINWYNDEFDNWWAGNSNDNATWAVAEHILEGVAGESSVRVRYTFTTDFSGNLYEGFAIDDINIYPQPQFDLATVSLQGPTDGCSLGTQQVTFTFWNKGLATLSNFPVGFSVNGGPVQSETVTASLAQGDSLTYTFNVEYADLSTAGANTIDVFTLLASDEFTSNDSLLGSIVFNYGSSTPLAQGVDVAEPISANLVEGSSSTIFFCGLPAGLNGGCFGIKSVTIGSITHSYVSDLTLALISPAGDTVLLSANNGGTGQNIANVSFDGISTNDITLQTAGIAPGNYAPQGGNGFNDFYDGQDPNGGWTLWIQDGFFGNDGTLNNWSLEFEDNSPEVQLPYADTVICLTHELDLTVPGTYDSYLWSTGQNTQTATLFGNVLGLGDHDVFVSVDYEGCSATSNTFVVTVDACASILELDNLSIDMYPNPSNGILTVDIDGNSGNVTIEVLDVSGKILLTQGIGAVTTSIRKTINLETLAAGVYFVRFSTHDSSITRKLVKQ